MVLVLPDASVATAELYVQDRITLKGVDMSVLSDAGVVSAFKTSVGYHLSQWEFVDMSNAQVSILQSSNVKLNTSCSLMVR